MSASHYQTQPCCRSPNASIACPSPIFVAQVTQWIYAVSRSWSGHISCSELRRNCFLQCAFCELDADQDLLDSQDLAWHHHHGQGPLWTLPPGTHHADTSHQPHPSQLTGLTSSSKSISNKMINRIFSRAIMCIEYWFRCMDLDAICL
ncbi:serine/threonine-protein phosphatase 2A regulatory subunit B'' subunit beta-like [Lepus europaeus]|uniref:serine/threonine-protein phosphatase 2A regulatory subunit B'' subunit beta-like n=1 Tax=Lepus europaeus TaxID=9983 RepID=UPI002B47D291|nr:serine/threonine-protein phosphatase 2A regulatory subunit B'' subunit beta-like [Lepus europaeus]XP_062037520.1 serine/threonine-protein phosphatase 2A regulatory subunit B'' subunit beta-like [Lepus europaeus]XP_062037521.1 serine/threonine-protein phosphatase 2A regulatory subunit B'' subunit beta-like [Lepus europaeus]XP_062037522.1 serine/threonine-protein phosphatase 2A regulatory subunit B'' subunit beta-like [Lepus europaeus]